MILPEWQRKIPLTEESAQRLLDDFIEVIGGPCTCVGCSDQLICSCSFDYYNSSGECLYEK